MKLFLAALCLGLCLPGVAGACDDPEFQSLLDRTDAMVKRMEARLEREEQAKDRRLRAVEEAHAILKRNYKEKLLAFAHRTAALKRLMDHHKENAECCTLPDGSYHGCPLIRECERTISPADEEALSDSPSALTGNLPQRQDSLKDQMQDVYGEATRMGCYDAADWIKERFFGEKTPSAGKELEKELSTKFEVFPVAIFRVYP